VLLGGGLPPEVVQLVHGQGSVVGRALVEHAEVPVISFTGSTENGFRDRRDVRQDAQAAVARDGRQERDES